MKRTAKIILTTFVTVAIMVPLIGCGSKSGTAEAVENQVVAVQRGNLTVDITAAGNLALSRTEDVAFEVSGTQQEPLTVEEVLVEEGDSVEEGQVLARLDTDALKEKLLTAQRAEQTAELDVHTAELNVAAAEVAVQTAETGLASGELAVKSAEIDLSVANDNYKKLVYPYDYRAFNLDVPAAIALISDAQLKLAEATKVMQELESGQAFSLEQYLEILNNLKEISDDLVSAKNEHLVRGSGPDLFGEGTLPMSDYWTIKAAQDQVGKYQLALDTAKNNRNKLEDTLNTSKNNLDTAKNSLNKTRINLDIARDNLSTANDELGKAVVVAPFAGFITTVNVAGGDEILKGAVAARVADPNKFEAGIMVSEMDILQVKVGGEARVQMNAMPGISLPAKVTHISPTATIQSGVVNYAVTVEVQPLETLSSASSGNVSSGAPQQQGARAPQGQASTAVPVSFYLREGLTVTVSIIVAQRNNVLLVPHAAVTSQNGQSYVEVVSPSGATEQRAVQIGISNWQYIEVISGLSEDEKVIVPQGVATAEATTSQVRGPMFLGRPPR